MTVAVVGLGLIGSGALAHLAEAGVPAVGVGPAEPPTFATHGGAFASHYDSGRITRHLDARREWAVLAARAIAGYADRQRASGIRFHRPTGTVLAELDAGRIGSTVANAQHLGVACSRTDPGQAHPFGDLLAYPPGSTVLAEGPPAGHIDPRRMLAANLAVAEAAGAEVVRSEATAIGPGLGPEGTGWVVVTAEGRAISVDAVVLAAGPHADELVATLPATHQPAKPPVLEVRGETVVLATLDADEAHRLAAMPAVLARLEHPRYGDLYVVPPTDYPDGTIRLKLGATRSAYLHLATAEAKRAWMRGDAHREEAADLQALLEALVPGLRALAWETKPCLITETPSDLPYLDHLAPGLVLAAGGNGYAAKSANAIGALAADLAVAGGWTDPELDAAAFALSAPPARTCTS